jgi:hypothetical protein
MVKTADAGAGIGPLGPTHPDSRGLKLVSLCRSLGGFGLDP